MRILVWLGDRERSLGVAALGLDAGMSVECPADAAALRERLQGPEAAVAALGGVLPPAVLGAASLWMPDPEETGMERIGPAAARVLVAVGLEGAGAELEDRATVRLPAGASAEEVWQALRRGAELARRLDGLRRRAAALAEALTVTRELASRRDLGELLFAAAHRVAVVAQVDRASILTVDEGLGEARVVASSDDSTMHDLRLELDRYPEIREMLSRREPVVVTDVSTDPRLEEVRRRVGALPATASYLFPVLGEGERVIGALSLRLQVPGLLGEDPTATCAAVAAACGPALQHAQAVSRLEQQAHRERQERQEAERLAAELARTEAFLVRVVDAAADGIVAADGDGRLRVFNRAAERITGWTAEEALGSRRLHDLFGSAEAAREWGRRLQEAEGGLLRQARVSLRTARGEEFPAAISGARLGGPEGGDGTCWVFTDLRERVRMEERLARAQEQLALTEKQAIVSEVSGALAHELNQPLTSVMGYAELLRRTLPAEDRARYFADTILTETQRMADIVRKIGRLTHYETKSYVGGAQILDLERSTEKKE